MGTICVLKTANSESGSPECKRGRSDSGPVSLLAFLQAENLKLRNAVAQLESDTMVLREALRRK
jgi:hypothetical protein